MLVKFAHEFSFGSNKETVVIGWEELPEAAQEFIINYGIKQYLTDGAAIGKDEDLPEGYESREEWKLARVLERREKLLNGTMSVRASGPRATSPEDKVRRELAIELLKIHYKNNSVKFPTGKELSEKIATFWAKNGDNEKLKTEVAKRVKAMELVADLGEIEL